jgi:hypothetical protein
MKLYIAVLAAFVAPLSWASGIGTYDYIWTGGQDGIWQDANWNGPPYGVATGGPLAGNPTIYSLNDPTATAYIPSGNSVAIGNGPLNTWAGAYSLTIDAGSQLTVPASTNVSYGGLALEVLSTLNNAGNIQLLGGSALNYTGTLLTSRDGSVTTVITGGGTITMGGTPGTVGGYIAAGNNGIFPGPGAVTVANQKIQGDGTIAEPNLTILSPSVIDANHNGMTLVFNGGGTVTNNGIMQASSGGTLQLGGSHWNGGPIYVTQATGAIQALDGSVVNLGYPWNDYGAPGSVTGGTLTTQGSGQIDAYAGFLLDGGTSGLTNSGNLYVMANAAGANPGLNLQNTINNTGTITLATAGIGITSVNATLTGGGTVNLGGNGITGANSNSPNATLTNVNNLIQGAGSISNLVLNNQGVINANTSGQTLSILGTTMNNAGGTLQASSGGTLQIGGGHWSGGPSYVNGGVIQALDGSTVLLGYTNPGDYDSAGTITGSTLKTAGSGVIQASNGMVLDGIANQGNLQIVNTGVGAGSNVAVLRDTIANTGSITLSGGNLQLNTQMFVPGNATLTGGGTVNMNGGNFDGSTPNGSNGTLTNADNLIQGAGSLTNIFVTNQAQGTIYANTSGQSLTIDTLTNQGTVRVAAGSSMTIGNLTNLSGGVLNGGTYTVAGTLNIPGAITTNAASITLDGAASSILAGGSDALASTFATNATGGSFVLVNGSNFTSAGSFSNAGTVNIGAGSTFQVGPAGSLGTYLQTAGSTKVNGTLTAATIDIEGGTLSGAGTLNTGLLVRGTLSPGNSPGTIVINGDYTQTSTGTLYIEAAMGVADFVDVHGNVNLDGTLQITPYGTWSGPENQQFLILDYTGTKTGDFAQVLLPTLAGYTFSTQWEGSGLYLDVTGNGPAGSDAPEPATCLVLGAALLIGSYRLRRAR